MSLTILVADDDLGTRLAITDFLELAGYFVVGAEDGRAALGLIGQCQPHLLITDITMPRLDGYGLVQEVRRRPEFRLLPVIFLTERTEVDERIRGYQSGCDIYLPKPFVLEELGAIVRNLLERSQMIQSEWRMRMRPEAFNEADFQQEDLRSSPAITVTTLDLTPREKEVLSLLAEGLSNSQIGNQLHLSPRTVEKYVSSLLRKTDTVNRADLVRFTMEHRLLH